MVERADAYRRARIAPVEQVMSEALAVLKAHFGDHRVIGNGGRFDDLTATLSFKIRVGTDEDAKKFLRVEFDLNCHRWGLIGKDFDLPLTIRTSKSAPPEPIVLTQIFTGKTTRDRTYPFEGRTESGRLLRFGPSVFLKAKGH